MPNPETTERTEEYRVVVDQVGGRVDLGPQSLADCRVRAAAIRPGAEVDAARIQTRTVTTTPWVDLDEGEGK